jgi:hypothetical protein
MVMKNETFFIGQTTFEPRLMAFSAFHTAEESDRIYREISDGLLPR